MNAHELANKMEQLAGHFHNEAINMLRQQADRIAELEDRLSMYEIKDLDKPQIKELSDEEIEDLAHKHNLLDDYPHKFARAILKKAREK